MRNFRAQKRRMVVKEKGNGGMKEFLEWMNKKWKFWNVWNDGMAKQ